MRARLTPLVAGLALVLAACSAAATPAPSAAPTIAAATAQGTATATASPIGAPGITAPPAALTVFAAASLSATMAKVKTVYEASNPGTRLIVSTDSSTALATKIEQGAPADILLSADTTNPQRLVDQGLANGGVTVFAGNLLAVIVPAANPAGIGDPVDLARAGVKVIACADNVPIATYTRALIANLGRQPGYPADYAARYAANIASREANVTAIVTKIGLGEGDAGIVYLTDAQDSTKVATIAVPAAANVTASYGGVVVKASRNAGAAQAFMAWLVGRAGQAVLADAGFRPPA